MKLITIKKSLTTSFIAGLALALAACGGSSNTEETAPAPAAMPGTEVRETPRFADGTVRFDRVPGEKGYWDNPSMRSLVEAGVNVEMDENGLLANIEDAELVAPFMDWSLALYKYRQENGLQDDPVNVCISPAGPRHMHVDGGFRIIQDRNFDRIYVMFGGGNRGWRLINMDGREAPDPDEVVGTYYGHSTGRWEGDTLVVESSGFNDRFWFSSGGQPHSPALRLTERFSRPNYDTLAYEVTIEDTRTYTRPWTAEWTMEWVDGEIEENFCEQ